MTSRKDAGDQDRSALKHQDYAVMSQVAHMYYDLDMLQPEIAAKLYFSRSKVSRMLKQARALGIVEIKTRQIVDRAPSIEKKLTSLFPLKEALVITCFDNQDVLQALTDFAALHISGLLRGQCRVGISNGKTMNTVVQKLRKIQPCTLEMVQLMGSATNTFLREESRHQVDEMLAIFSGKGYFLNTPLYIDDVYAKDILMRDPSISEVFARMRTCDMILTSVGTLGSNGSRDPFKWYGYQTQAHEEELRRKGAVGSICAQYYDIDGRRVPCEWNDKLLVMPLDDIKANGNAIAVACGEAKVRPILGALRGGLINVLITDAATAVRLIEEQERLETAGQ